MSIGELARSTGVAVRTIRFYCDEGILDSHRSVGGHRLFEAESATARLLLVRRLRALGLGLESIAAVLRGERSMAEVLDAESARLDDEFRTLAWRRASVRALGSASSRQRADRLALLAAAQDGGAMHDGLIRFWRRVLAPIPRDDIDRWVGWNVPEPPATPSAADVVAYAELAALAAAPGTGTLVRHQYWRTCPELIRDPRTLYAEVGDAAVAVVPLVADGVQPYAGPELDRFVDAHAIARRTRDSPHFRAQLLAGATDADPRIYRYWALTRHFLGTRVTVGQAHDWLFNALAGAVAAGE
ncbi:MerR family transcriptional regulator [Nocardia sp. NPDC048505]|uniref:MerR family transcriptional regulator n=1 Tax=unclassified Nocardia TaxID=2637762 RepID=UPI0033F3F3D2